MPADPARAAARTPVRPPRDLRLDIVRGWLQLSIFAFHAFGGFAGAWLIHSAWGLSDSSEQFVFLSGLVLGSVFALKAARTGEGPATRDMLRRTWRLYLTHLVLFFMFGAMVFWAEMQLPLPGEVARLGWAPLAEDPLHALLLAPTMLWQPEFMGILPVFVWCMLALPPFLWLTARAGAWALLLPVGLWAGVQLGLWYTPTLAGVSIAFDPLAWQLLFLLGAWCGRQSLLQGRAVPRHPWLIGGAVFVVLGGLWVRLIDHGALPGPALDPLLLHGKENLVLPRLLHALALAYLVACLVPRESGWMRTPVATAVAAIGRHSLHVFCIGLFLSWVVSTALRLRPEAWWLDPLLTLAAAAVLAAFALIADRRRAQAARGAAGLRAAG
jgi:hypothetical protein